MLATEEPTSPSSDHPSHPSLLEQWPQNERMRHIPSAAWMVQKLDGDLRRRIEKLWLPYSDLAASDPHHPALEAEFRALCRAIDRVAVIARHHHRGQQHPPNELGSRMNWTINQAVASLHSADNDTFGKRLPFQTFERSNGEPLWAAMLGVIQHVQRLIPLIREIDPDIDDRLYEGLVQLQEPLRREPIA
ncbi:MAG TPA: hypothetical protein VEK11_14615 [Thermoanaerobaculia bacterium]|jgi:hypothetical protein|nr:hypothetical protein [Thermoanaerobaculia bacterium]